jgi:glycosyltransferase involved in cell wall biosynthesis
MPVRQEAVHVAATVGAVLAQDYPADRFEVVVADGMSDDGTREALEGLRKTHPNLVIVDNPGRIAPTGLNAAIRASRGSVIVRIDGHTRVAPDYVRACVSALERTGADNAGGKMTALGDGAFGEAVAAATSSPFGVGNARFHYSDREEWVDTVYLGAWPRRVFDRIGLFDEELVRDQDDELNYRLRASGGRILLSPSIRSWYTVRGTPTKLWRQYFQYGFWKVRVLQKHPRQMQPRQFVPGAFVAGLVGLCATAAVSPIARGGLAALALVYGVADVFAASAAARGRWRLAPAIALTFPILHLAYGSGFLAGIVRFAGRWLGGDARAEERLAAPRIGKEI